MSVFWRGRGTTRADAPAGSAAPAEPRTSLDEQVEGAGPEGAVLDDRYRIGRLLGTGGMASVHAARDLLLGREVAVKLFRRDARASPDLRLQEIEARVVATLNHSALTTLLDAGIEQVHGGHPQVYLVMEFVRGSTLRQRLRRGPLEVSEACWLGFDLAEGLDYMHQAGFIHRDVKPANILLSDVRSARPVVAKLTDFGIAAPIGEPDLSEYTVGTAAYLSPEQVEGRDARPESDIYSLGIVLLEAITGVVAFPGSVEESAFARLERDPPIPGTIPAPIADLLARMTTRRPEERVDLHHVAIELQQFLVDDLVRRRAASSAEPSSERPPHAEDAMQRDVGTAADPVCDALVRLAASSTGAGKALLVVEHQGRLAVKAQHGWTAPVRLTSEQVPSRWSGAGDLRRARAGDALPVEDPAVRAVASATLAAHGGEVLGELYVLDDAPHEFGAADRAALDDVADLLVHDFELRAAARRAVMGALDAV